MAPARRRLWAVLAVAVLALAGCSGSDGADDATPAFGWETGEVLLPPFDAAGFQMRSIVPQEPTSLPAVVTTIDGETVVTAVLDEVAGTGPDGLPELSPGWVEPGPTVQGRPSVLSQGDAPFQIRGAVVFHVDEETVVVASRTATPDVLVDVAQGVRLPLDAPGAVPGELVGVLPARGRAIRRVLHGPERRR